jgi:hypothetical protein
LGVTFNEIRLGNCFLAFYSIVETAEIGLTFLSRLDDAYTLIELFLIWLSGLSVLILEVFFEMVDPIEGYLDYCFNFLILVALSLPLPADIVGFLRFLLAPQVVVGSLLESYIG